MSADPQSIAAWVSRAILPHEGIVRNWLNSRWGALLDVDDVLQETYCRLSELPSVAHIRNGRAYFFTAVRAVAIDMVRAARLGNVRTMTEIDWLNVIDDNPLPDQAAEAGQELVQVEAVLSRLSWTCRQVIELRRIHGLSQAETARRLGVSEHVVENNVARGVRSLLKAIGEHGAPATPKDNPGWNPANQSTGTNKRPNGRQGRRTGK